MEESSGIPIYVAIAIGALSAGYAAGAALRPKKPSQPARASEDSDGESSSDDDTDVSKLELLPTDECKLVGTLFVLWGAPGLKKKTGSCSPNGPRDDNGENCCSVSEILARRKWY
ncbi:hypothetical protein VKT23_005777 [Stygiomarasmius scandens]|uniref:Uncharacterized protein n=1 Tax=Marasmiellus scandens TaxID=2682957 RepID=A0ABR1JRB6_9AGAR